MGSKHIFFRTGSLNELQTAFDKLPALRREALWQYFELPPQSKLPDRTSLNYFLDKLDPYEINHLIICLMKQLLKSKLLYNHTSALMPYNTLVIGCDGFCVHCYTKPHSYDAKGQNNCPYCLPRVRNKGKESESTHYLHTCVTICLLFPGGFSLPLFVHPLRAESMQEHKELSDEEHKQQCELNTIKEVLPLIKREFPKQAFHFLGDSLYANEPIMKLLKSLNWSFSIVRQKGSLKNLAKRCNKLSKTELYHKYYKHSEKETFKNKNRVEREYAWFNGEVLTHGSIVHVLRFKETTYNPDGKELKEFKTEWLLSERVSSKNCRRLATVARSRADHEDIHNTLKNRGYAAGHDFARANSTACMMWKMIMFLALWIFELFEHTTEAIKSKGSGSWVALARDMLTDLIKIPWEQIRQTPMLMNENVQFRYIFSS